MLSISDSDSGASCMIRLFNPFGIFQPKRKISRYTDEQYYELEEYSVFLCSVANDIARVIEDGLTHEFSTSCEASPVYSALPTEQKKEVDNWNKEHRDSADCLKAKFTFLYGGVIELLSCQIFKTQESLICNCDPVRLWLDDSVIESDEQSNPFSYAIKSMVNDLERFSKFLLYNCGWKLTKLFARRLVILYLITIRDIFATNQSLSPAQLSCLETEVQDLVNQFVGVMLFDQDIADVQRDFDVLQVSIRVIREDNSTVESILNTVSAYLVLLTDSDQPEKVTVDTFLFRSGLSYVLGKSKQSNAGKQLVCSGSVSAGWMPSFPVTHTVSISGIRCSDIPLSMCKEAYYLQLSISDTSSSLPLLPAAPNDVNPSWMDSLSISTAGYVDKTLILVLCRSSDGINVHEELGVVELPLLTCEVSSSSPQPFSLPFGISTYHSSASTAAVNFKNPLVDVHISIHKY